MKPSLADYPAIPWETMDLRQFDLVAKVPAWGRSLLEKAGSTWKSLYIVPIESGRGCPYGCDFCTVTGFFGDSIRFRSDDSVVDEILRLKNRAAAEGGKVGVFFIDDNFAINGQADEIAAARHDRTRSPSALGGADQHEPAQGRGALRPHQGERRSLDLHGPGVDRSGQP